MRRVLFVDVLRLLALLQMVNGHTLDAVLAGSERIGPGFDDYRFVRGLVSVAFLVVAGISFQLTTLARFERHKADERAVQHRLKRAIEIIAIGYLLQVGSLSSYVDPKTADAALRATFRTEVLQCIGMSLMTLELLTLWAKKAAHVVLASAALAGLIFALSPYGELASHAPGVSAWRTLIGHGQGSQFPLLPWSGYVFAGVVLGSVALPKSGETTVLWRVVSLSAMAAIITIASRLVLAYAPPVVGVLASSRPWFVLEKLAVIALVLAVLAVLTHRLKALPRSLTTLGGETLAIFVFHLQVIYGTSWSFAHSIGRTLPLTSALGLSLTNIALSIAFGLAWHSAKARLRAWQAKRRAESARQGSVPGAVHL